MGGSLRSLPVLDRFDFEPTKSERHLLATFDEIMGHIHEKSRLALFQMASICRKPELRYWPDFIEVRDDGLFVGTVWSEWKGHTWYVYQSFRKA